MARSTKVARSSPKRNDGWYHNAITVTIAGANAIAFVIVLATTGEPHTWIMNMAAGALLGLIINPDLDIDGLSSAETIFNRVPIIGTTLMHLWGATWGIYAKLIPHRSPLSHWPLLGTSVRAFYLLCLSSALSFAFYGDALIPLNALKQIEVLHLLAGLAQADFGHWLRDKLT